MDQQENNQSDNQLNEQPIGNSDSQITSPSVGPSEQTTPQSDSRAIETKPLVTTNNHLPKKKWLPLAIAGGALLLLAGGASAYYFGVYQNPDHVLASAYKNLVTAKQLQLDGSVDFDMDSMSGVKLKSVAYEAKSDATPGAELSLKAKLVVMSSDIEVGGKGMFTESGDLYFQLNGLKDAMQTLTKTAGSASTLPTEYLTAIEKLQDQWVKVTRADMEKQSESSAKTYQCLVDVAKKHKDSDNKELAEAYKKNGFVQKKEDLGYKDGNVGYKLNFDETKFKAFVKDVENTPYMKDLKNCEESSTVNNDNDSAGTDNAKVDNDFSVSVWIDQWNHHLKKVEYSGSGKTGDYKVSAKGTANIGYDKSIKVQAPNSTITLDEFTQRFDQAAGTLGLPSSDAVEQDLSDDFSSAL